MSNRIKPSDMDKILSKKSIVSGTVNFGSTDDFPIYGITTDVLCSKEDYNDYKMDSDNRDITEEQYEEMLWENWNEMFYDRIIDVLDKINNKLECWRLKLGIGYYDGYYISVDESDNWWDNHNGEFDEASEDKEFQKQSNLEKEKLVNDILPRLAEKFELCQYSKGWTQSIIRE